VSLFVIRMEAVVEGFFPDLASLLKSSFPSLWSLVSIDDENCSTPYIYLNGKVITHPFLCLSAIAGMLIGFSYGSKIIRSYLKTKNSENHSTLFYGLSFLFFGCMNIGGIVFHCIQPPPVYIETISDAIPSSLVITHLAHVLDVCSTCCASLSFLFGRLEAVGWLQTSDPLFFSLFFFGIYIVGYIGMIPTSPDSQFATTIPFIAELLYPGVICLVLAILPFCQWQFKDYPILLTSSIVLSLAFGLAGCEVYLCQHLGSDFTAAGWCFFFSDLTFLLLAQLTDLSIKQKIS
jgi:hypothetical protein